MTICKCWWEYYIVGSINGCYGKIYVQSDTILKQSLSPKDNLLLSNHLNLSKNCMQKENMGLHRNLAIVFQRWNNSRGQ